MEVIINSKDTNTHTIQGIQPNLFSEQIDLLEFINDDKINNIEVQLCFTNVQKQSEIILTHIYITTEKSQYKNILYGSTKQHEYNITQNNDTYSFGCYTTDWGDCRHETDRDSCVCLLAIQVARRPPQSAGRGAFKVVFYP